MTKQEYRALLSQQPTHWIVRSMTHPSIHMTPMHVALHAIVLRRRKALEELA
jgi:hypothetical protein